MHTMRCFWILGLGACLLTACTTGITATPCPTCAVCPTSTPAPTLAAAPTVVASPVPDVYDWKPGQPTVSVFQTMIWFFTEDDWPFSQVEGKTILRTAFQGKNGDWNCFAQAMDDQSRFLFYSVSPTNIPEEKRAAVAEYLTRANYGLIIGNFEMDYNDGEVRYKTSIDVEGDRLTLALIKQAVYANVFTFDRYLPGLEAVISGEKTPLEAVMEIERE